METVTHTWEPVWDEKCRILILGTMPSPQSRKQGFYYGHPRNRFFSVMAEVLGEPVPQTIDEKRSMLLRHHVALWDVLQSCDIEGAQDASIRNPAPQQLDRVLDHAPIGAVFTTGKTAFRLYQRFFSHVTLPAICLPSPSPANCAVQYEDIVEKYRDILMYLETA